MKSHIAALFTFSILTLAVAPVQAADLMVPDPSEIYQPNSYDPNGFYVGATLGAHQVDVDVNNFNGPDGIGLLGGVFVGYTTSMGGLVLGAEADVDASRFSSSQSCPNAGWTCEAHVDGMASLRGRIGYAVDTLLFYGTAGLAIGSVGGSTNNGTSTFTDNQIRVGWTAGVGAEADFGDQWFGRVEYRYTNFGSRDMQFDVLYPGVTYTSHALRLGVGYRF